MGRERGLPIRRRAMLLLLIALAIDVRGSAKAPAELQRPLLPRLDALRLRGGAPQPVPASFDQNVAELVEYLREQSCTKGNASAVCTCGPHLQVAQDHMSAEESDEPNYDSLREESRTVDSSEGLRSGDREAGWNDSEAILERHPRDMEDAERQLDLLYQRQLDLEKRKMNPKCDCEYCLKLRAHTPRAAAAVDAGEGQRRNIHGDGEQGYADGEDEDEDALTSLSDGDEMHLTKQERRARDRQMYRHILFVRNLPPQMTTDELCELFGKYGMVLCISTGARQETSGTAYILYNEQEEVQAAIRALTGVRLKDKYLILQTHNPKRMFKLARGEEGGGEESTHDDDKLGVFLQMVNAVARAARGKVDLTRFNSVGSHSWCDGQRVSTECHQCGGQTVDLLPGSGLEAGRFSGERGESVGRGADQHVEDSK